MLSRNRVAQFFCFERRHTNYVWKRAFIASRAAASERLVSESLFVSKEELETFLLLQNTIYNVGFSGISYLIPCQLRLGAT